jgi:hypothetical protein
MMKKRDNPISTIAAAIEFLTPRRPAASPIIRRLGNFKEYRGGKYSPGKKR